MQFKKTIRITPHPQPLSHASGERGEKTLLLAPLPEFGEGPGVGSVLRLHKLNCIIASAKAQDRQITRFHGMLRTYRPALSFG